MTAKTVKFNLVMTNEERKALDDLAREERISQAAVLRRLIWQAAHPAYDHKTGQMAIDNRA